MKALVTGGGGFLGGAIARQLLARGDTVRSVARGRYPELERDGVEVLQGDLATPKVVQDAVAGCDIVFHVAAKAGIAGPYGDYWRANVLGTLNIIEACRAAGIHQLVHTSSPSVVFDGTNMEGANESLPYSSHHHSYYSETKAQAERYVIAANSPTLATVALRPHLIWGPGDNHLLPRLLRRARKGKLRRVGDGTNVIDGTYIDDAARAHLLAADRLEPGSAIAGKAYFIGSDQPIRLWDFANRMLGAAGLPPITRSISSRKAHAIGTVLEWAWKLLPLPGEPPMTRFVAGELATSHWFDLTAAKRDLGYTPQVTIDQGMRRVASWIADAGI